MRPRDSIGAQIGIGAGLALHGDRAQLLPSEVEARREVRRRRDHEAVGRGGRLQPRGRVHHVARHPLADARPASERDDDLSGRDADAHGEGRRILQPQALHLLPDAQRGPHRALGVVLVGDGNPEDPEHHVADDLLDRSAEPLDLPLKQLVEGPQRRREVLGVQARLEASLHIDDVGEQRRDQPAFLAGGVQRGAARDAEPSLLGVLGAAVGTDPHAPSLRRATPTPGDAATPVRQIRTVVPPGRRTTSVRAGPLGRSFATALRSADHVRSPVVQSWASSSAVSDAPRSRNVPSAVRARKTPVMWTARSERRRRTSAAVLRARDLAAEAPVHVPVLDGCSSSVTQHVARRRPSP